MELLIILLSIFYPVSWFFLMVAAITEDLNRKKDFWRGIFLPFYSVTIIMELEIEEVTPWGWFKTIRKYYKSLN